ncbi:MAG: hypothetical protein JNJ57_12700 [Saprospiraceae bacterium]|nr:hypothetical protein [Saprospiraceae bacterium]
MLSKISFPLLAYAATYATIWLHELGHALVFRRFGCKPDLFDLYVPFHFGAASPAPLDAACVTSMNNFQLFLASMGGISANLLLSAGGLWLLRHMQTGSRAAWFFSVFVLANLTEAASYLTLSNIRPLGDMIDVQNYCPAWRLPLGLLGIILVIWLIQFLKSVPPTWRIGLSIFCAIMAGCMVGMRFVFAS